jgi:hypothetical protein
MRSQALPNPVSAFFAMPPHRKYRASSQFFSQNAVAAQSTVKKFDDVNNDSNNLSKTKLLKVAILKVL